MLSFVPTGEDNPLAPDPEGPTCDELVAAMIGYGDAQELVTALVGFPADQVAASHADRLLRMAMERRADAWRRATAVAVAAVAVALARQTATLLRCDEATEDAVGRTPSPGRLITARPAGPHGPPAVTDARYSGWVTAAAA